MDGRIGKETGTPAEGKKKSKQMKAQSKDILARANRKGKEDGTGKERSRGRRIRGNSER